MNRTAATIAAVQRPDGSIPWEAGRHTDPWNHTEAAMGLTVAGLHDESRAAYDWLAATQNVDGSWYAAYRDGHIEDPARDTNFSAYVAVGVLHHWLSTRDKTLDRLWPTVRAAIDFVVALQRPDGAIPWHPSDDIALLSGCSSIYHALRCASVLADATGDHQPHWISAAHRLAETIRRRPNAFEPKPHAMDWYYPVLAGIDDISTLRHRWHLFVVPGLGVHCVHDQPWVTGGETAELALTLAVHGDRTRAAQLMDTLSRLEHTDGSYWTGFQYANDVLWPHERTTWTAGAALLAQAALAVDPATTRTFGITR